VGGLISGLVGKACNVIQHGGRLVTAGKKLASGHLGSAVKTALGDGASSIGQKATFALGLAAVVSWVLGGAKYALNATANVIGHTTAPQLRSTWFSATYWRVAGIAAVLTLPFLFAAAIQALVQSDLALLIRAALGYLPLAVLAVSIAAPVTMLLLAATDQLSAIVSSAAGHASAHFLNRASGVMGTLTLISRSPFLVFFVGVLTVIGAIALWFELLLRSAAVYVIVLMLPLAFAALVWPARRIWAIRSVEVLLALILSKFMIVAVLSLGGAALSSSFLTSASGMLAGFVLLALGAATPWMLLRLLPLGEVASGAVGSWRREALPVAGRWHAQAEARAGGADAWADTTDEMRRQAEDATRSEHADPALNRPLAVPQSVADLDGAAPQAGGNGDGPQAGAADDSVSSPDTTQESATATTEAPERSPGLDPIWQSEDWSWPSLTLGLEDGWPPPPVNPGPCNGQGPQTDGAGEAAPARDATPSDATALDPGSPQGPPDDHDPTPPPQPPEGGPL
jgi:hypothetical protein